MRLTLRIGGTLRRWHLDLLSRLVQIPGLVADADLVDDDEGLPASAAVLFALESLVHGLPRPGPASPLDPSVLAPFQVKSPSEGERFVLDLSGVPIAGRESVWRVSYDGAFGEAALLGALLDGASPVATVMDGERRVGAGRLGTESHGIMLASFEDAVSRCATLILSCVRNMVTGTALPADFDPQPAGAHPRLSVMGVGTIASKKLARAIVRKLGLLCFHAPHWRVGWRALDGPDVIDLRAHPAKGWRDLPDDGSRFYADPFPIQHKGRTYLFVEDFEHRSGKGVIAALPFDAAGPVGQPETVLELRYHLSYPCVFARDGEVWMVPESCANRTIDLYRARAFPGDWVKESTLVSDIVASDATLVEHHGRWWMFATVRGDSGSFSDALHLWSAPDFRGPWHPHAANPVLIDIASARPAGHVIARGGELWRPVQDCRQGYGAALALARIRRLDDDAFEQTVEATLTAGPNWAGRRIHTLNSGGGFEFIDGSAPLPLRFGRRRQGSAGTPPLRRGAGRMADRTDASTPADL